MNRIRSKLFRWAATVAAALLLWTLRTAPALAGNDSNLTIRHAVAAGTSTFVGFGPVGPGCDATTAGADCTFFTSTFTASGKSEPGGPFTQTGTSTVFFGAGGSNLTFAGSVVTSVGAPVGFCSPTFLTAQTKYANGTIDLNATGTVCCTASPPSSPIAVCGPLPIGPPSTTNESGTCTSGTGKYAGIQCSTESTASTTDGVHFLSRGETLSTK